MCTREKHRLRDFPRPGPRRSCDRSSAAFHSFDTFLMAFEGGLRTGGFVPSSPGIIRFKTLRIIRLALQFRIPRFIRRWDSQGASRFDAESDYVHPPANRDKVNLRAGTMMRRRGPELLVQHQDIAVARRRPSPVQGELGSMKRRSQAKRGYPSYNELPPAWRDAPQIGWKLKVLGRCSNKDRRETRARPAGTFLDTMRRCLESGRASAAHISVRLSMHTYR